MTGMYLLFLLLTVNMLTGLLVWRIRDRKTADLLHIAGSGVMLITGLTVAYQVVTGDPWVLWYGYVYLDSLSALNLALLVTVGFTAAVYSVGYMHYEEKEENISRKHYHQFFLLFHAFIFSMLLVAVVNNIGLIWVGIELTTLVSALLVGFYKTDHSLEAAWKYLIMGSVGIAFALLGIIFIYIAGANILGETQSALNWTELMKVAPHLNSQWVLTGFVFILIGFGTKAGLAPMHFWLPDAHSQAPAPVSAVLSGVLLNSALYGILRIYAFANNTVGGHISQYMIFFGLLSMAITIPFILVQYDLKRMLAFSSVEHMGIITLGVGIGGPLGVYGAMLHMFNHSMAKTLLFMAAGNVTQKYHTKQIGRISGVLKTMPVTGYIFLIAAFAIAGSPPFNVFISEYTIMMAGFASGNIIAVVLFLLFIVLIFAGMIYYIVRMSYGEAPPAMEIGEISRWSTAALFLPLIFVIICGIYVPSFLSDAMIRVSDILQGVNG